MSGDRRRGGSRVATGGLYCAHCGTALEASMNFCPDCGRPTSDDGSSDPNARPALERRVAAAMRDGWELEHDFGDHVVMVRRSFGSVDAHLVVAALTVWWTMGLGNALYGAYRYVGDAERMVLRAEQTSDEAETDSSWMIAGRVAGAGCLATALALVGSAVFLAGSTIAPVLVAAAIGLATVGLGLFPGVRRRFGLRRSPSTNGSARTVDERSITDYDRPCAACTDPVGRGLERVYRKGFYVLGVPVTLSEGRNAYCRRCANAEADGSPTIEEITIPIEDSSTSERETELRR
ncbi:zinc-ribbon domain-containing protein [Natronococcus amylolyticus]|nr:zinc-ribbon domain-containing protein [Natronococcus amylolyticus]